MADVKIYTATKTDEVIAQAINSKCLNSVVKDVAVTEDGTGIKVVLSNGTETVVKFPAGGSVEGGLTQVDIDSAIDALNLEQYALKSDIPDLQDLVGGVDEAEVRAIVEGMDLSTKPTIITSSTYRIATAGDFVAGVATTVTTPNGESVQLAKGQFVVAVDISGTLYLSAVGTLTAGGTALPEPPADPSDVTPPVAGGLSASNIYSDSFTLDIEGASDVEGLHSSPYAYSKDGGVTWTAWMGQPSYTFADLTPDTEYQGRHVVRDGGGNETVGQPITVRTLPPPPVVDNYTSYAKSLGAMYVFPLSGPSIDAKSNHGAAGGTSILIEGMTYDAGGSLGVGATSISSSLGTGGGNADVVAFNKVPAEFAGTSAWTAAVRAKLPDALTRNAAIFTMHANLTTPHTSVTPSGNFGRAETTLTPGSTYTLAVSSATDGTLAYYVDGVKVGTGSALTLPSEGTILYAALGARLSGPEGGWTFAGYILDNKTWTDEQHAALHAAVRK